MFPREWYGWHFPEMGKIITDNLVYAKTIKAIGMRNNTQHCKGLEDIMPEEVEKELRQAAEISMGTEITEDDLTNIFELADRVIELSEYRYEIAMEDHQVFSNRSSIFDLNFAELPWRIILNSVWRQLPPTWHIWSVFPIYIIHYLSTGWRTRWRSFNFTCWVFDESRETPRIHYPNFRSWEGFVPCS